MQKFTSPVSSRHVLVSRGIRATGALAMSIILAAGLAATVLGADPPPSPIVFSPPQLLVWEDSHGTYNGPVIDGYYALVPNSQVDPNDNGHFILPDGSGGVFHYFGHVVDGPFGGSNDLCPKLLSLGIDSVSDLPGYNYLSADQCRAFLAPIITAEPTITVDPYATATDSAGGTTNDSPGDYVDPDPISLDIAAAIILALLGIGSLGVLARIFHKGPFHRSAPNQSQSNGQSNPCAAQLATLEAASSHARGLNSVLATLREFYAGLDEQIVMIEKAEIPATLGVDVAFLAGSFASKLGPGLIPKTLLGKIMDGLAKDQAKSLVKKTLGSGAFGLAGKMLSGKDARESAAKATLKVALKDGLLGHYADAAMKDISGSSYSAVKKAAGAWNAADKIAGSMADAVGHLLTLYSSGASLATLVQQSAILRAKAMTIYGDIADLQEEYASAMGAMHEAAERLTFCQKVNAPDWKP